jgi:hypothetical protein
MRRDWKRLALAALLALGLMCVSARAGESEETIDEKARAELKDLKKEVAELRARFDAIDRRLGEDMRSIREQLDRMESRLSSSGVITRSAFSISPDVPRGTIRLVNRLGSMAWVTINGVSYGVPPLETRVVRDQPAGWITYEVTADGWGVRPPVRTLLGTRRALSLVIHRPF